MRITLLVACTPATALSAPRDNGIVQLDIKPSRVSATHAGQQDIRYFIGEHDGIEYPFDRAVYRAYFYWRENRSVRTRSFSIQQLSAHITECKTRREPTHKLELALERLRRMNGF